MISDLYVITSEELSGGRSTLEVVQQALQGGANVIQLREKSYSSSKLVQVGRAISELTKKYNATFIVNDRVDVAFAVDADGVHLGQDDMHISDARRILGKDKIIGISVDNLEEALLAEKEGADYLGVGPVFPTNSKKDAAAPLGIDELKHITTNIKIPVVAIGGINKDNLTEVIKAGAASISVISAVVSTGNIKKAATELEYLIQLTKEMI